MLKRSSSSVVSVCCYFYGYDLGRNLIVAINNVFIVIVILLGHHFSHPLNL